MENIYLSVVIPVFNESNRIDKGLQEIIKFLKSQSYQSEIILVDDGSTDDTYTKAQSFLKRVANFNIIRHQTNQGKGAAIKSGILKASGEYILFTDIDLSTPIAEIEKLLVGLENHDLAIGVRRHPQAKVIQHQSFFRESLGHIFTKLTNVLVAPGIFDATCGFKAFRKSAARKIFNTSKLTGWAFDAEVLFLARKFGYSISQMPIVWANDEGTKVHILKDGTQAFIDLLKIRWWNIIGYYDN